MNNDTPALNIPILRSPGSQYVYDIVDLFQRLYRSSPVISAAISSDFMISLQDIVDEFSEIDDMIIDGALYEQFETFQELKNDVSNLISGLCRPYPESWMHGKITQALNDYFNHETFYIEEREDSDDALEDPEIDDEDDEDEGSDYSDDIGDNPDGLCSILAANMTEIDEMFT